MTPQSRTLATEIQGELPAPLSVPDHLRVVGPMNLPDRDRREHADTAMHQRRDEVVAKVKPWGVR